MAKQERATASFVKNDADENKAKSKAGRHLQQCDLRLCSIGGLNIGLRLRLGIAVGMYAQHHRTRVLGQGTHES